HRVERDVGHGLAEDNVEHQQVVERRLPVANFFCEYVRRLHREARAENRLIDRDVACCDGAGRGMPDGLSEPEILEEIARIGLAGRGVTQGTGSSVCTSGPVILTNP